MPDTLLYPVPLIVSHCGFYFHLIPYIQHFNLLINDLPAYTLLATANVKQTDKKTESIYRKRDKHRAGHLILG